MVRTPCCDETGLKKGTWTAEEDLKLIGYVTRYGCWNWRRLPKFAGLTRCGKSCRLRWLNYLRPNIKRGNFSKEEEDIIIQMHGANGNKWSMIAAKLDGRTDNEVKNHWHTNLKKRLKQNMKAHEAKMKKKDVSQFENTEEEEEREPKPADDNNCSIISTTTSHQSLESFIPMSPPQPSSSSELSNINTNWQVGTDNDANSSSETNYGEISGDFWTQPFVADSFNNVGNDYDLLELIDPEFAFSQSPVSRGALLGHFGFYEEQDCLNW